MAAYLADKSVTTETGPLAKIATLVVPSSVWTAAMHNYVRTHEKQLKTAGAFPEGYNPNQWFWTGDGSSFGMRNGEPVNYLTGAEHNLVLRHPQTACNQIMGYGYASHTAEEAREIIDAVNIGQGIALRLNALNLRRQNSGDRYGHILLQTKNAADTLKGEPLRMAEQAYGIGVLFEAAMKSLYDQGTTETRMWNLIPESVVTIIESIRGGSSDRPKEDPIFSLASYLGRLRGGSWFGADNGHVDRSDAQLRGVSANTAEGGMPQVETAAAYRILEARLSN